MDLVRTPGALSNFLTEADLAAIRGPVEKTRGPPGRAYGVEFYALEQRRLFPRSWCAVAFAREAAEPGDAQPVDHAGWPLLLVRGKDRRLRAFLNICRHRAMCVQPEPQHELSPGSILAPMPRKAATCGLVSICGIVRWRCGLLLGRAAPRC